MTTKKTPRPKGSRVTLSNRQRAKAYYWWNPDYKVIHPPVEDSLAECDRILAGWIPPALEDPGV